MSIAPVAAMTSGDASAVTKSEIQSIVWPGPAMKPSSDIALFTTTLPVSVLISRAPFQNLGAPNPHCQRIAASHGKRRPLTGYGRYRDRLMAERVAVLGTGTMGAPMARNLLKPGFQVRVWNSTPDKARVLVAEGAELAETPADAVREAAFVITMLTDAAAGLAVMRQAAESVPDGAVWLQTSMVGRDVERVAGFAEDHGVTFVDCPVIGTRETAKHGRRVVLASGPGDGLDRAQPIFAAIGLN